MPVADSKVNHSNKGSNRAKEDQIVELRRIPRGCAPNNSPVKEHPDNCSYIRENDDKTGEKEGTSWESDSAYSANL